VAGPGALECGAGIFAIEGTKYWVGGMGGCHVGEGFQLCGCDDGAAEGLGFGAIELRIELRGSGRNVGRAVRLRFIFCGQKLGFSLLGFFFSFRGRSKNSMLIQSGQSGLARVYQKSLQGSMASLSYRFSYSSRDRLEAHGKILSGGLNR